MTIHPSLGNTLDLIRQAHHGQVDKTGAPYWTHPLRVMLRLPGDATDAERHAALLHDVIEDTDIDEKRLAELGYSAEVIEMVRWLTKDPAKEIPYHEWIETLAIGAPIGAIRVKRADLGDNTDPERLAKLPDGGAKRRQRYEAAKVRLEAALNSRSDRA